MQPASDPLSTLGVNPDLGNGHKNRDHVSDTQVNGFKPHSVPMERENSRNDFSYQARGGNPQQNRYRNDAAPGYDPVGHRGNETVRRQHEGTWPDFGPVRQQQNQQYWAQPKTDAYWKQPKTDGMLNEVGSWANVYSGTKESERLWGAGGWLGVYRYKLVVENALGEIVHTYKIP
ncbi:MAG: hypothetical protein Q9190_007922 [Brigantiaea leucoxantha]